VAPVTEGQVSVIFVSDTTAAVGVAGAVTTTNTGEGRDGIATGGVVFVKGPAVVVKVMVY
jgi:hypothetical protein